MLRLLPNMVTLDTASISLVFFANFFTFCNQYHGGTNFGRTAGGPFITTSYDYDAPIDEYGNRRLLEQPSSTFPYNMRILSMISLSYL